MVGVRERGGGQETEEPFSSPLLRLKGPWEDDGEEERRGLPVCPIDEGLDPAHHEHVGGSWVDLDLDPDLDLDLDLGRPSFFPCWGF